MRTMLTATLCTAAVAVCLGVGAANAAPAGLTADAVRSLSAEKAGLVEEATWRRRGWYRGWHRGWNRCHWVRRTYWHRGHRHVRWVRVCRRWWW